MPINTLVTIYNSLILPYLDYCSSVWGSMGKDLTPKVQNLQNRVARIITHSNYDTRSKDILNNLGWKDLAERRRHQLATIMFKTMNGQVPQYISQLFTKTSDIHAYSLRHSGDSLFIPRPNTEALKPSL